MDNFFDWLSMQQYRNDTQHKKNNRELGRLAGLIKVQIDPSSAYVPLDRQESLEKEKAHRYPRGLRDPRGADVMAQNYEAEKNASLAKSFEELKKAREIAETANSLQVERNQAKGFLGINERDDGSVYFTGSEQRRQALEKSIGDYDREIAKLQAEIAMSEAGDPMYDLAVMRMIMNDDMSLMNDIRGRIGKKIDQEFQTKQKKADQEFQYNESELNRQNTLDVAKLNKQEQDAAKKQDLEDAAERAADVYMSLKRKLSTIAKDDARYSEVEDQLDTAKILMKQAYRKAGKLSEYDEVVNENKEDDKTLSELKTLLYRMHGATSDDNFKDIYTAADAEQRKAIDHDAELLKIPMSKLPIAGIKGVSDIKNEQNDKAKKKKADFQKANKAKKFEINILTGKPKDPQAAESWLKKAREAGWTNVEIQSNGVPLWK